MITFCEHHSDSLPGLHILVRIILQFLVVHQLVVSLPFLHFDHWQCCLFGRRRLPFIVQILVSADLQFLLDFPDHIPAVPIGEICISSQGAQDLSHSLHPLQIGSLVSLQLFQVLLHMGIKIDVLLVDLVFSVSRHLFLHFEIFVQLFVDLTV